jgi:hypothetical protein
VHRRKRVNTAAGLRFDKSAARADQPPDRFLTNRVLTKFRLAKRREKHYKISGFITFTKCRGADCRSTGNAAAKAIHIDGELDHETAISV